MAMRRERRKWKSSDAWTAVVLLVACIIAYGSGILKPEPGVTTEGFQEAKVVRVVDGDTLKVRIGQEDARVRLIGIDSEESVAPEAERNTEKGREAAEFTKALLPEGTKLYLQKDVSETDRYGRLLRYAWLELPENPWDPEEVRVKMVNGILVDKGQARARAYPPDTMYEEIFQSIEHAGNR